MGWLAPLSGALVGIDTAPVIYYIEQYPAFHAHVRPFFEAVARGSFATVTSMVTVIEVLVQPLRRGDLQLANEYRDILLRSAGVTTLALSEDIAEETARVRAQYNLRTPDAIHIATALHTRASFFLTNDASFRRVPGIQVLVITDLVTSGVQP